MKYIIIIIIYYSIQCDINSLGIVKGEYHICNVKNTSYLFHKFNNLKEDIFPRDLRINLSLSKIVGTMFYSIDRHKNQVIISLDDGIQSNLEIEINGDTKYVSLQQICGCKICRYTILDLRIQLGGSLNISCNRRDVQIITFAMTYKLNKNYPIPDSWLNLKPASTNEANMWLVNTPLHENVPPNNVQLTGCIFNVSYNDEPISFTNKTGNIEALCPKACINDICHGGVCHESYSTIPVCDCTLTFLNGPYCNDTIFPINILSFSKIHMFDIIKVSWRSSVMEIFVSKNEKAEIGLSRINSNLYFRYMMKTMDETTILKHLSRKYAPNKEYILIASFSTNLIEFQFCNNGTCENSFININYHIGRYIFDLITLQSGDGVIDLVSKPLPTEYNWNKVIVVDNEPGRKDSVVITEGQQFTASVPRINQTNSPIKDTTKDSCTVLTWSTIMLSIICVILIIIIFLKFREKLCFKSVTVPRDREEPRQDSPDGRPFIDEGNANTSHV